MPSDGMVLLTVHDVLGREVARLVNGREAAGIHEVTWAPVPPPRADSILRGCRSALRTPSSGATPEAERQGSREW